MCFVSSTVCVSGEGLASFTVCVSSECVWLVSLCVLVVNVFG